MERKVDGALFQRLPQPPYVQLTALGRQLYPICVQIRELLAKAQTSGCDVNGSKRRTQDYRPHAELVLTIHRTVGVILAPILSVLRSATDREDAADAF
jgi:DNA-binding transcriptional LysR family regulator